MKIRNQVAERVPLPYIAISAEAGRASRAIRIGAYAGMLLGLELPQTSKRLYTIVETDGCFADGVSVATGCWLGRRTMRLIDLGKVAATCVDTRTERAFRLARN